MDKKSYYLKIYIATTIFLSIIFIAIPWTAYDWIWVRNPSGVKIGLIIAITLIMFIIVIKNKIIAKKPIYRFISNTVITVIILTQIVDSFKGVTAVIEEKIEFQNKIDIYVIGYGTFANTWSNIVIHKNIYHIFSKEVTIKRFNVEVVRKISIDENGNLKIELFEYGKATTYETISKNKILNAL